jgi:predicted  nucleic acid-binding Zn-ribbon protein
MTLNRLLRPVIGILAVAMLVLGPACRKGSDEPKELRDVAEKVGELDKLSQKANTAGAEQTEKLKAAGVNDVRPNPETLQLTEEQKQKLEERVKSEKDSSYRALLQEVIDKDKQIADLNEQIAKLKAVLPKPDVAKSGDNHYSMALRFLRKKGISEAKAKALIDKVNILEKLAPGFEVYHFYNNGVYGTWVTQGRAKISPNDLVREEREKVEGERDTAIAENEKLQEDVNDLQNEKNRLSGEIDNLRVERTKLINDMNELSAVNESQKSKLNSMHYVVGNRDQLKKDGVIVIPVFARDRAGSNWSDKVFTKALDLRTNDALTFTAADAGVKQISKVSVVPGSLEKDKHYSLTISPDKQTVTVKLLVKDRFVNEKVVFAVVE